MKLKFWTAVLTIEWVLIIETWPHWLGSTIRNVELIINGLAHWRLNTNIGLGG